MKTTTNSQSNSSVILAGFIGLVVLWLLMGCGLYLFELVSIQIDPTAAQELQSLGNGHGLLWMAFIGFPRAILFGVGVILMLPFIFVASIIQKAKS